MIKLKGEKLELNVEKLDKDMSVDDLQDNGIKWLDPMVPPFLINGFAWFQQEKKYRRLPEHPNFEITEAVDVLADCTAGGQIRFQTTATKLAIKVKLSGKANMPHMAATGQCGFDCYIGDPTKQQFVNVTRYDHFQQDYEIIIFERQEKDLINITLHFPLYQGVEHVFIGVNEGAEVKAAPHFESAKKVIFYGTSITQGGCASRPGMAYPNILSRRFNMEFINLGFSGNGKGEGNMARLISEIENPACLILDYEPNCVSTELYKETLPEFIRIYRESHLNTPILLVSKFPYAAELINKQLYNDRNDRLNFQKELIEQLKQAGDQNIYFYEGTDLLGEHSEEGTVDGTHPTDLGFMSIANKLTPVLRKILHH